VALPESPVPEDYIRLWYAVKDAQSAAFATAKAGALTRHPDEVARSFFRTLGLESYFTHRLGHGAFPGIAFSGYVPTLAV